MNFRNIILSGLILLILPLPALAGSKNFVESYNEKEKTAG